MNVFINFKNYPSGMGQKQVELLDFLEETFSTTLTSPTSPMSSFPLHLLVPSTDIAPIWEKYNFPLWSQHCDPVETSRATGWISAEMLKEAGACGTMLNHSEHRLPWGTLQKTAEICREKGLKVLICCQTVTEGKKIAAELKPDFLAFEPPELIASKTQSVISDSTSRTSLTSLISQIPPTVSLLVGAGIRTHADIQEAQKLGASGVLLASAVMEGKKEEIKKLLMG